MIDFNNRRAGLLFGSFSAEALSLGVHWIYDPNELARMHGRVTSYKAPGADSHHPHKQAGDQGHVGDQALRLLGFLQREQRWDAASFMEDWVAMWPTYNDYIDKATKTTLAKVQAGTEATNAGSESDELAGPARIAPLVAFLAEGPESDVVRAAVEQTNLTHHSLEAEEAATFLARASYQIMHGADLEDTVRNTAPEWALTAAESVLPLPSVEAIAKLGPACPIPSALPSIIYLALKHGNNTETVFIENAMAGGDNCARGLALGLIVGAANGLEAIPEAWRKELRAASQLTSSISSN